MRALCGAIITAGAMIGLGLTALAIGTRYGGDPAFRTDSDGKVVSPYLVHLSQMDRPLIFILVLLTTMVIVGVGISFLGLAYHHYRRHQEHLWEKERAAGQHRTTV